MSESTAHKDRVATYYALSPEAWRAWLGANHASEDSVWLILYKKDSGTPSLTYRQAVEEALCFGWIDSKPNKRDAHSYYQFFARRNPKSNWSRLNKTIVEQLLTEKRMAPAGLEMVKVAKETGTWTALDDVENLVVPQDLREAFDQYPKALTYWEEFPRSVKRGILEWILNAKRTATRQKRIEETARMASENKRANQFRP